MSMKVRLHLFSSLDVNRRTSECVSECSNFSNTIQKHPRAGPNVIDKKCHTGLQFPPPPSQGATCEVLGAGEAWSGDGCVKRGDIHHYCQQLKLVLLNCRD